MSRFATRAVHGEAARHDEPAPHAQPLFQTAAFSFPTSSRGIEAFGGAGYIYTRVANPTTREVERLVAALESTPVHSQGRTLEPLPDVDALFFASGMAAISAVALSLGAGARVVCQGGIYGSTEAMMGRLRAHAVRVDFAPAGDLGALADAVERDEPPALVWIETPANPLLQLTDVRAAAEIAHDAGAVLAVDATFATPALLRPLAWGADLVVHSTTKFMSGHGVAMGGVVSGRKELVAERLAPVRKYLGGVADPFAAWLTLLGLRTLDVRMERHVFNARALAEMLTGHPRVSRVFYPDPGELPDGQLAAPGPMISFEVEGGEQAALGVIDRLALITLAPTLGTVDTLVQHPYTMSHSVLPESRRLETGIAPGIIRMSVGLEDASDLAEDLERALAA